jgi:hypothetical protein
MRDLAGKNIFAVADSELERGRTDAAYNETKHISQEAEYFLAGVLDGLTDGQLDSIPNLPLIDEDIMQLCLWSVFPCLKRPHSLSLASSHYQWIQAPR